MARKILILTASLLALASAVVLAAGAVAAQPPPIWNSGYNHWWPGGFGYPPVTVQAHGFPCSVTAYGPTFHSSSKGWSQDYGAGTGCAGGVGVKTLIIRLQTLGADGHHWFTVAGSTFFGGPTTGNPLRMIHRRPAYLGHAYRTVATAKLVVPNGHAGCSLSGTCSQTITITATSRGLAP